MAKHSKAEKQEAFAWFHKHLQPGDTIYTILEHRSSSGMTRDIRLVILKTDDKGKPYALHPNHSASVLLDLPRSPKKEGIRVSGCGMDMGFHLVYSLASRLWPNGTPEPHGTRNGVPDSSGGYALNHRQL